MANTFIKIQTVTVGTGGAATIGFTSIPQTYSDLKIVLSSRSGVADTSELGLFSFNGLTTNFTSYYMFGSGNLNSVASQNGTRTAGVIQGNSTTASIFGNFEIYIPNYTSSNNKSFNGESVTENNASEALAYFVTGVWANTAAITSITLTPNGGTNFREFSTATLYGIKNT